MINRIINILALLLLCIAGRGQHVHDHPAHGIRRDTVALSAPRTVVYHLHISDTTVNYTGKPRRAIAVNGQIPGPELRFTEGDTAEIHVHNTLRTESSVHWHGLILPNRMDGVPYLTTAPIPAGGTAVYRFPLVQSGTYWYHSHTGLQEQIGLYGPLVIEKREDAPMKEYTLLLSDWTDERPGEVHRSLRAMNDWYLIQKKAVQSYGEALVTGNFSVKLVSEWKRQHAMDVSDVYYGALLANGRREAEFPQLMPGEKLRLRVINGSSSTYFWLQFAGGKLTVAASDGKEVVPVEVDRMIVGVAETYDLIVSIPDAMSYEFRATAEDRTGHASLWLGGGMKMPAPGLPRLDYFAGMRMMNGMVRMNGNVKEMGMSAQGMDMNAVMYPELRKPATADSQQNHGHQAAADTPKSHDHKEAAPSGEYDPHAGHGRADMSADDPHAAHSMGASPAESGGPVTLNYTMLRSPGPTALPGAPWNELRFTLDGNMERYVWSMDGRVLSEADRIPIRRGGNVRLILLNNSMMRHPMHLHGHYFRVLNGQGDRAPLKNVVDIMPGETDTLEFAATESGDWFFHCHILYHMMSGMGRVFSYGDSPPNPDIDPDPTRNRRRFLRDDRMAHFMVHTGVESNGTHGQAMLATTRYALLADWHTGWNGADGYKATVRAGRYLGRMQRWFPYAAWDYHYSTAHRDQNRNTLMFGLAYTLPLFITADLQADVDGRVRLGLSRRDIPLTTRLRLDMGVNTDWEYHFDMRYILTKYLSLAGNYDSDMGWGAGITITY